MTLKIDFKVKFKVIGCLPLNPTTFVRVIFRYHLYLRSYLRGWIKMAHPVYIYIYIYMYICICIHRVEHLKCYKLLFLKVCIKSKICSGKCYVTSRET